MAIVPDKLFAGDTLKINVGDKQNAQMTLTNAANNYNKAAALDGDDYFIHFNSAETATFVAGNYRFSIYEIDGADRETLQTGFIEVLPDFTTAADQRSHVEKVLASIEATLEGKATQDHEQATINGRSIKRFTPEQLLAWRDKYRAELATIKRKEALANGLPSSAKIQVRF